MLLSEHYALVTLNQENETLLPVLGTPSALGTQYIEVNCMIYTISSSRELSN